MCECLCNYTDIYSRGVYLSEIKVDCQFMKTNQTCSVYML